MADSGKRRAAVLQRLITTVLQTALNFIQNWRTAKNEIIHLASVVLHGLAYLQQATEVCNSNYEKEIEWRCEGKSRDSDAYGEDNE